MGNRRNESNKHSSISSLQLCILRNISKRWLFCLLILCTILCIIVICSSVICIRKEATQLKHRTLAFDDETTMDTIGGGSYTSVTKYPQMDVVYTWVNGSDPIWLKEMTKYKEEHLKVHAQEPKENEEDTATSANRFRDNDELKYSLRSIEVNAPWIHRIFIVTNGQVPEWLDTSNPRIRIVTHEEIFLDKTALPTFSSPAIELNLHHIRDLSDYFIYFNDDVFLGRKVYPYDFMTLQRGQMLFGSWDSPDCSQQCKYSMLGDEICDRSCNVEACGFDLGDCKESEELEELKEPEKPEELSNYEYLNETIAVGTEKNAYCAPFCNVQWLGDHSCDKKCNVPSCGFDGYDCKPNTTLVPILTAIPHCSHGKEEKYQKYLNATFQHEADHFCVTRLVQRINKEQPYVDISIAGLIKKNSVIQNTVLYSEDVVLQSIISVSLQRMMLVLREGVEDKRCRIKLRFDVNEGDHRITHYIEILRLGRERGDDAIESLFQGEEAEGFRQLKRLEKGSIPTNPMIEIKMEDGVIKSGVRKAEERSDEEDSLFLYEEYTPSYHLQQYSTFQNGRFVWMGEKGRLPLHLVNDTTINSCYDELEGPSVSCQKSAWFYAYHTLATLPSALLSLLYPIPSLPLVPTYSEMIEWVTVVDRINVTEIGMIIPIWKECNCSRNDDGIVCEEKKRSDVVRIRITPKVPSNRRRLAGETAKSVLDDISRYNLASPTIQEYFSASHDVQSLIRSSFSRRLSDTYKESLVYTNMQLIRLFGFEDRKVPAHMPHLINKQVMYQIESELNEYVNATIHHRFREGNDLQYAFLYFHYLYNMERKKEEEHVREIWRNHLDVDGDGVLNRQELQTLFMMVQDVYAMNEEAFLRCLLEENATASVRLYQTDEGLFNHTFYTQKITYPNTYDAFRLCDVSYNVIRAAFPYSPRVDIVTDEFVAFQMINDNYENTLSQLNSIRGRKSKFVCINDDIHEKTVALSDIIRDFYNSFFPYPSQFEKKASVSASLWRTRWGWFYSLLANHYFVKYVGYGMAIIGCIMIVEFLLNDITKPQRRIKEIQTD